MTQEYLNKKYFLKEFIKEFIKGPYKRLFIRAPIKGLYGV